MATIKNTTRDIKFLSNGRFNRNPYQRYVGIEVEFSNYNDDVNAIKAADEFLATHYVSVGGDGSIRGNKPTEIRISPMNGDYLFYFLDDFYTMMNSIEAESNASCGIHMHIDFNDVSIREMEQFFYFWTYVEPFVFRFMLPLHRQNSSWCKPFANVTFADLYRRGDASLATLFKLKGKPNFKHRFIAANMNAGDNYLAKLAKDYKLMTARNRPGGIRTRVPHKEYRSNYFRNISRDRYCAANIAALGKAGTIEFRMFNSNWNNIYLQNWILFLLDIIEYSRVTNMKTLVSFYDLFKESDFLRRADNIQYQKDVYKKLLEITPESEGFIQQRMKILQREKEIL